MRSSLNAKLDTFLNLYEKIQADKLMMRRIDSQPFKPHGTQTQSVKMLKKLRNKFIHFRPRGWSLKVRGLPRLVADCLNIIDFLAFECGNILWHDPSLKTKTKDLIGQVKSHLDTLNRSVRHVITISPDRMRFASHTASIPKRRRTMMRFPLVSPHSTGTRIRRKWSISPKLEKHETQVVAIPFPESAIFFIPSAGPQITAKPFYSILNI